MVNIRDKITEVLDGFKLPYFLQGTLADDEPYPESFITFLVYQAENDGNFDDEPTRQNYYISVMYYDSDPDKVETYPRQTILPAMKEAGFIPEGVGTDVLSDEPTHTGKALDFVFIDNDFSY